MKAVVGLALGLLLVACGPGQKPESATSVRPPLVGTWRLLTGTLVEKGDTTVTDYTKDVSFIKIINDTHFAFFLHDLAGGKGKTAAYNSGGGRYTLTDSLYTEHLEYSNDRQWEKHDFPFVITIQNDTLVQQGIEKVPDAGIERLNIERYVRVKE